MDELEATYVNQTQVRIIEDWIAANPGRDPRVEFWMVRPIDLDTAVENQRSAAIRNAPRIEVAGFGPDFYTISMPNFVKLEAEREENEKIARDIRREVAGGFRSVYGDRYHS